MITQPSLKKRSRSGLSLIEIMVAIAMATIMSIALIGSLVITLRSHQTNRSYNRNMDEGNTAMQRVVYGFGVSEGLREVKLEDVAIVETGSGWRLDTGSGNYIQWDVGTQTIQNQAGVVYARDVISSYAQWNQSSSGVLLGLQIEDHSLKKPIIQTLESLVKFRN